MAGDVPTNRSETQIYFDRLQGFTLLPHLPSPFGTSVSPPGINPSPTITKIEPKWILQPRIYPETLLLNFPRASYFIILFYNPNSCAKTFSLKCRGCGCLFAYFFFLLFLFIGLIGHRKCISLTFKGIFLYLYFFVRGDRVYRTTPLKYACIQKGWNTQMLKSMTRGLSSLASTRRFFIRLPSTFSLVEFVVGR